MIKIKQIEKLTQFKNKLLTEKCSKNNHVWKEKNIMDRIKTFEDACLIKGVLSSEVYSSFDEKDVIAYRKLRLIVSVLNEGWIPNLSDLNERKYYPYFSCASSFSYSCTTYDFTLTYVGSRLCFKTEELAIYAGKQFLNIYKEYLN